MEKIERKRHLAKTLTWRVLATTDTFLIAWFITGKFDLAAGIAGIEILTKMFLYYCIFLLKLGKQWIILMIYFTQKSIYG